MWGQTYEAYKMLILQNRVMCLIYFATKREYDIPLFVDAVNSTAVQLETHNSTVFPYSMKNPVTAICCLVKLLENHTNKLLLCELRNWTVGLVQKGMLPQNVHAESL